MREIHKKITKAYYEQIESGEKTFEFRLADFECEPGDVLILDEYEYPNGDDSSKEGRVATGRSLRRKVGYVGRTKDFDWLERPDVKELYKKHGAQIISLLNEPVYEWHNAPVPDGLKITQVHGLAFNEKGELFLRNDRGIYKTTGGTPEPGETLEEALKREFMEEANIVIDDLHYLGYQTVDEGNGKPLYAQVRMVARVVEVQENRPDPDNGRTYERIFVDPNEAPKLLNYGPYGDQLIHDACEVARSAGLLK